MNAAHPCRAVRRGFTLMEMLVVLGILVLLLAIVAPRILGTQKKADLQATEVQIKVLGRCLKQYAQDMKEYPATEQGLKALVEKPGDLKESLASRWDGPYIEDGELPKDPWNNDYQYEYPPTHGKGPGPDVWSFGPDGENGTDYDIVSWKKDDAGGGAAPAP